MNTVGLDARAFFALPVGTSPADARIVQDNVLPVRKPEPVTDQRRRFELPSAPSTSPPVSRSS